MPFIDLQSLLGTNLDHWILQQSGPQPNKRAARCHAFEKEWIECAHGIGQTRAKKECQLESEDFYECMHRQNTEDGELLIIPLHSVVLQEDGELLVIPLHSVVLQEVGELIIPLQNFDQKTPSPPPSSIP